MASEAALRSLRLPCSRMTEPRQDEDFLERMSARAEEALGKVAEELISNPVVNGAISRAFDAREKAIQAQVTAMGALNLPSAADIERVTRRLRSLSQRLEGIEDAIDRLEERVEAASRSAERDRIASLEERLDEIARDLAARARRRRPGRRADAACAGAAHRQRLLSARVAGLAEPQPERLELLAVARRAGAVHARPACDAEHGGRRDAVARRHPEHGGRLELDGDGARRGARPSPRS